MVDFINQYAHTGMTESATTGGSDRSHQNSHPQSKPFALPVHRSIDYEKPERLVCVSSENPNSTLPAMPAVANKWLWPTQLKTISFLQSRMRQG
jgi:hypothetical protein